MYSFKVGKYLLCFKYKPMTKKIATNNQFLCQNSEESGEAEMVFKFN